MYPIVYKRKIWASSIIGEIFLLQLKDRAKTGTVNGIVSEILQIEDDVLVHTKDNKLWHSKSGDTFEVWQNESSAGNFITQNYELHGFQFLIRLVLVHQKYFESSPQTNMVRILN